MKIIGVILFAFLGLPVTTFAVDDEPSLRGSANDMDSDNSNFQLTPPVEVEEDDDDESSEEWIPDGFHHRDLQQSCSFFMIINEYTGKALDVSMGHCHDWNNIWEQNRTPAQLFRFGKNGAIISVGCNKALDIAYGHCNDGQNVQIYHENGTGAQQFWFDSDGTIRNTMCNKALDIFGTQNGANIAIWPKRDSSAQRWRIQYV